MQIVIPMSGLGKRFRRAGFSVPKLLIIAHVIDMGGVEYQVQQHRVH